MTTLVDILVGGVLSGLLYILVAVGFSLIFGTMEVINFAHGYLVMWGGYVTYLCVNRWHVPFVAAVVVAALVIGLAGVVMEFGLFRRVAGQPFSSFVVALGLGVILLSVAQLAFGADPLSVNFPVSGTVHIFNAPISVQQVVTGAVALGTLIAMYLLLAVTNQGRAIRAVALDPDTAALQGIDRRKIYALAFGVSAATAGLAGSLIGSLESINLSMGDDPLLKAFVIVVIGGLGSIGGTAVAGLIVGVIGSAAVFAVGSGYSDLIVFAAMFLFLIVRPRGLFGRVADRV